MHSGLKLFTGLAATVLLARVAMVEEGRTILGRMGWWAQTALQDGGVTDGSMRLYQPGQRAGRTIYLSGTADLPVRAAIIARLKARHPLVRDVRWEER